MLNIAKSRATDTRLKRRATKTRLQIKDQALYSEVLTARAIMDHGTTSGIFYSLTAFGDWVNKWGQHVPQSDGHTFTRLVELTRLYTKEGSKDLSKYE